jgi:hypothetical protein
MEDLKEQSYPDPFQTILTNGVGLLRYAGLAVDLRGKVLKITSDSVSVADPEEEMEAIQRMEADIKANHQHMGRGGMVALYDFGSARKELVAFEASHFLGLFSLAVRIATTNDAKLVYHFSYDKSQEPSLFYRAFDFIESDREKFGAVSSILESRQDIDKVDALYKSLTKLPPADGANFNPLLNAVTNTDRAQNEDWIHLKTTLYFIALESLFSDSDKADIAFKVSLRTASFLYPSADEKDKKEEVYALLKIGYDFRSRFLHGSDANIGNLWKKLDKSYQQPMKDFPSEMNAILCKTLERMLLTPELFALFTKGSEMALREYFDRLVL